MSFRYGQPVSVLKTLIPDWHFLELIAYDQLYGWDEHRQPEPEPLPQEQIVKTMRQHAGAGPKEFKKSSLNRRLSRG